MAALPPTSPTFRRKSMITAGVLVTACAFALGPAATGVAAPKPTKSELKAELAGLNKKVDKLIGEYGAKRAALADAQKAESKAKEHLKTAQQDYDEAAAQVGTIAQLRYQNHDTGLPALMFGENIGGAALLEQLAAEQQAHVEGFATARDEREKAAQEAGELTDRIRGQAEDVNRRRKEAEKLIGDIERKLDQLIPAASGRRPDGSWAPELPGGGDNITPRTRLMRDEVRERFAFGTIGCYRVDTSGEHPLGRACDFMLSGGGAMPTADRLAMGDQAAAWVIKNAGKLGVKYVIYKQRIYNIGAPGWRGMSDRGSITQNHWDHVHVSMY
ncbi:peptidoglycan-binding protein LysM [Microtetraspora sp. NBRC 13810]|uniref:coiled-coil domain-containing protein n=1 Tax=Microtetraspora sp. NBRC 13810 TaxID=3030990 RepID=UPI0024A06B1C|nr:hypothetical protein [Microtetraspora sp. NBRC 13810]GLW10856.1 peptidoglycan-binding protein LysM [Microtetraspora sp. NBRC 13810]